MKIIRPAVAMGLAVILLCLSGCAAQLPITMEANEFANYESIVLLEDSVLLHSNSSSGNSEDDPYLQLERLYFDGRVAHAGTVHSPPGSMKYALVGDTFYIATSTYWEGNQLHTLDLKTNILTSEDLGEGTIVCVQALGNHLILGRSHSNGKQAVNTCLEVFDAKTSTVVKTFDVNSILSNFYNLIDVCTDGNYFYVLLKEYRSNIVKTATILKLDQNLELVGSLDISAATEMVSSDIRRFEVYGSFLYLAFNGSRTCIAGTLESDVLVRPETFESIFPVARYDQSAPIFRSYDAQQLYFINDSTNALESKPFSLEDGFIPSSILKSDQRIAIFAGPSKTSAVKTGRKYFITDLDFTGLSE